jgi:hypothetical protein
MIWPVVVRDTGSLDIGRLPFQDDRANLSEEICVESAVIRVTDPMGSILGDHTKSLSTSLICL